MIICFYVFKLMFFSLSAILGNFPFLFRPNILLFSLPRKIIYRTSTVIMSMKYIFIFQTMIIMDSFKFSAPFTCFTNCSTYYFWGHTYLGMKIYIYFYC